MEKAKSFFNAHLESYLSHCNAHGWRDIERGIKTAITAYVWTNTLGLDTLVVRESPYMDEVRLFLDCLAEAGITEFLLCDLRSHDLMVFLNTLLKNGWQVCEAYENNDPHLLGLRVRKGAV